MEVRDYISKKVRIKYKCKTGDIYDVVCEVKEVDQTKVKINLLDGREAIVKIEDIKKIKKIKL